MLYPYTIFQDIDTFILIDFSYSDGRYSHGKLAPIDLVNDESESSSSEDVEEIIEAKVSVFNKIVLLITYEVACIFLLL